MSQIPCKIRCDDEDGGFEILGCKMARTRGRGMCFDRSAGPWPLVESVLLWQCGFSWAVFLKGECYLHGVSRSGLSKRRFCAAGSIPQVRSVQSRKHSPHEATEHLKGG